MEPQINEKETDEVNPSEQEKPKSAKEEPKPSDGGAGNPNPADELTRLKEKYETVKRQYSASSEEALRLKSEVEGLKAAVKELKESHRSVPQNDEEFNRRVAEVGMTQAIREMISGELKPISEQTERIINERVDKTLNDFKTNHPGLTDEILAKFDKEFSRLRKVYDDPIEAMEAAYAVVGGLKADEEARQTNQDQQATKEADVQSKTERQELSSNASGGGEDRQASSRNPNADATAKLEKLEAQAIQNEMAGRDATHLWLQIEKLKSDLVKKSASRSV